MTNFLHWRKATWALLLWSAAAAIWLVAAWLSAAEGMAALAGISWALGMAGLGFVWFISQPLVRQGRGVANGFFIRPGRGNWRLVNLHRSF